MTDSLSVCFHHVTCTLDNTLTVKNSLIETGLIPEIQVPANKIRTHNRLVYKQTLNFFAKLARR